MNDAVTQAKRQLEATERKLSDVRFLRERLARIIDGPEASSAMRPSLESALSKLTAAQQTELFEALQGRPADGGLWSGPKVTAYVRDHFGVTVRPETGWRWLTRLGLSLQVPRPKNPRAASAEEQQVWKRRPGRPPGRAAPRSSLEGDRTVGRG